MHEFIAKIMLKTSQELLYYPNYLKFDKSGQASCPYCSAINFNEWQWLKKLKVFYLYKWALPILTVGKNYQQNCRSMKK